MDDPTLHRRLAVDANNSTWELLGKPHDELTPADVDEMTKRAYAAAYHWDRAEGRGPENEARAEWLVSKVWLAQRNGPLALHHGERCLAICTEHGLADFDRAYAHEAVARSLALLGRREEAVSHRQQAAAVPIAEDDDRELVVSDLAAEPWFGL